MTNKLGDLFEEFNLRLISERNAAETLGITSSTLARWRKEGTGPKHIAVGTRIYYNWNGLREWLNCGRAT